MRAGEPAPFWLENLIAVIIPLPILAKCRSDGYKLSNVWIVIIFWLGKRWTLPCELFWWKKKETFFRSVYFLTIRKRNFKSNLVAAISTETPGYKLWMREHLPPARLLRQTRCAGAGHKRDVREENGSKERRVPAGSHSFRPCFT